MTQLSRLSSSLGVRGQEPNEAVARDCIVEPDLLLQIAEGFSSQTDRLVGDCAEVMTKVAATRPELVAPHADALVTLISHRNGRVRWEAAHALSLVAPLVDSVVENALPFLVQLIRSHDGVIVRDYAIDAVGRYGAVGPRQAREAWAILEDNLVTWEGGHAARILGHAGALAAKEPELRTAIVEAARRHEADPRAGARKAAKALLKSIL